MKREPKNNFLRLLVQGLKQLCRICRNLIRQVWALLTACIGLMVGLCICAWWFMVMIFQQFMALLGLVRSQLQFGRIWRRLGLPLWTLMGIGVAGWMFDPLAALLQQLIAGWLGLENKPTSWKDFVPSLILLLIPILIVTGITIYQAFGRARRHRQGGKQNPEPKKGIILLVSNPNSAKYAIDYHLPVLEQVWLIPSNDTAVEHYGYGTRQQALQIEAYCQALQNQAGQSLTVKIESGVSPAEAQETYDVVNRIFRTSRHFPNELIADFTGGTKPMSVGMIMACLPRLRELEYVSGTRDEQGKFQSHGPFIVDYQHSAFNLIG